jgi:hypothetical protein
MARAGFQIGKKRTVLIVVCQVSMMFAMLESILYEHDIVTLQEADKHPESGPSQHYRDQTYFS